jgi:glycosyltransferase A (GT-A) superfamily protein (DUF2064 family)
MDGDVPTVLIGMDTPQVTPELLTRCLHELVAAGPGTAVLGAAADGGWWALGLHSPAPARVLTDVPMSREDTAELTRSALVAAGLVIRELPVLTDIDRLENAVTVAPRCAPGSRTRRVVAEAAAALGNAV